MDYRKLRLAQELSKPILKNVSYLLMKYSEGMFLVPSNEEIVIYLNDLAKQWRIKHYILKGAHDDVILFDPEDIEENLEIELIERNRGNDVIKIQCYDEPIDYRDSVPIEISKIESLYRIPNNLFNSGTCIYFLCHQGKVVYVGQAENVHSRLLEHKNSKIFDDCYYMRVPMNKLDTIEHSLISFLKPMYNKTSLKETNKSISIANSILNTTGINE